MLKTVNGGGGKIYYLYICSGMRGKPLSESSSVEPPKRLKLGAEVHRRTAAYAVPAERVTVSGVCLRIAWGRPKFRDT